MVRVATGTFDPLKDNDPANTEEAVALARAWASGKRSWTNALYYLERDRRFEVCAVMDAQEVVKFSALARMFAELESRAAVKLTVEEISADGVTLRPSNWDGQVILQRVGDQLMVAPEYITLRPADD